MIRCKLQGEKKETSAIKREYTSFCSSVSINKGFLIQVYCRPDHQNQQEYSSLMFLKQIYTSYCENFVFYSILERLWNILMHVNVFKILFMSPAGSESMGWTIIPLFQWRSAGVCLLFKRKSTLNDIHAWFS